MNEEKRLKFQWDDLPWRIQSEELRGAIKYLVSCCLKRNEPFPRILYVALTYLAIYLTEDNVDHIKADDPQPFTKRAREMRLENPDLLANFVKDNMEYLLVILKRISGSIVYELLKKR